MGEAIAEEARIAGQIDAGFPEYSRLYAGLAPNLEEIQSVLREGETYISYLFTDDARKPIALVLGKRGPARMVQLPGIGYEIKQLVAAIQEGILDKEPASQLDEKLKLAGAWLVDPLQLAPGAKLVVEADEELSGLPLALAVDRRGQVGASHRITYVPSAGVFLSLRRSGPGTGKLYVGFGRGRFEPPLRELTAVGEEIAAAGANFGPATGFSDPEAPESAIYQHADEVRRARVLHLATHTVYRNGEVGLLFHEGVGEDGLLTEREILARLTTSADLVVLSGCDTARLDREGGVPGEAFSALTRAFFAIGAKKLLITQWDVDDRFASIMVTRFMRAYIAGGDASLALAEAQRAVREDPAARLKDWAGWVLLSD
jgi:CHAT domain-containing protein